jgi:hypothetical protein
MRGWVKGHFWWDFESECILHVGCIQLFCCCTVLHCRNTDVMTDSEHTNIFGEFDVGVETSAKGKGSKKKGKLAEGARAKAIRCRHVGK